MCVRTFERVRLDLRLRRCHLLRRDSFRRDTRKRHGNLIIFSQSIQLSPELPLPLICQFFRCQFGPTVITFVCQECFCQFGLTIMFLIRQECCSQFGLIILFFLHRECCSQYGLTVLALIRQDSYLYTRSDQCRVYGLVL